MTDFETHPDRYLHWKLQVEGPVARLLMSVEEDKPYGEGYRLKLNSYDLGVDIELADAVQRLRFEHPEVKVVVVTSDNPQVFCAGANILMLRSSSHGFKVNFCKYTNETRCSIEDATLGSGQHYIAALNGTASGGGYELAIACEEIHLVDDGNSAVSLPEVPLLGVLPGTGGLTRLVDKRKVRRDLADCFSTLAEGCKAKKAVKWGLVDGFFARSKFDAGITELASKRAAESTASKNDPKGIKLEPLAPTLSEDEIAYKYVTVKLNSDERLAELIIEGPSEVPGSVADVHALGSDFWALRAFRELDDALCRLRFDHDEIGLVNVKTKGDLDTVVKLDNFIAEHRNDWLVREILLFMARTLRRFDVTAKSFFAIVEPDNAFGGCLFELALASDRIYMLDDQDVDETDTFIAIGALNGGALPMGNGLSRMDQRFLRDPEHGNELIGGRARFNGSDAFDAGLVTAAPDDIDWDDEVRIAIEERLSLSPDALTGMEASLRFAGPETLDTKIYGRLSAWQNWIFIRPNATGETGALKLYGEPTRPKFDWRRT
jgi:benzoyl-CoA-dihydrodiol lyase